MNEISDKLAFWYDLNSRDLPWRHTRDAYRIWLSEIILQQTRVAQGMEYYLRFVEAYPDVRSLAQATEDEVLKMWQGLGYYSRARNLLKAARQVVEQSGDSDGNEVHFPTRFRDLIKLKGIGQYTAAAIASFAADEEVAVVDGNVYRVLSRLLDIDTPIDTPKGQKEFQQVADVMMHDALRTGRISPAKYNQAIMEFGALHCTPTSPQCESCPLTPHCLALSHKTVNERPVKQGRIKVRERHFDYLIYIYKDTLWVHQRGPGDIWQGLWEFVLNEKEEAPKALKKGEDMVLFQNDVDRREDIQDERKTCKNKKEEFPICILKKKHQLTHQTIYAEFHVIKIADDVANPNEHPDIKALPSGYEQVTWKEWQERAVPRLIDEANAKLSAWF